MIPLQLELENFLSYRRPIVLDLDGIHLACISGANGAGKSSILDAMTWALFGQSRSKSDDDIVNRIAGGLGQAAEVRLSFQIEGQTYRVIRSKQVGKTLSLEFQVATEVGDWKALSEGRVRETQAAVESLLRMNYDTFVNSSFLLQGQADAFTTKTPNKRKEILADLLGVNVWDVYREQVAERRKEAEGRVSLVDARIADIDQELGQEETRRHELAQAQEALAAIKERLQAREALLEQGRKTEAAVRQQEQTVGSLAESVRRAEKDLADLRQRQADRQKAWQSHQALLAEAEDIEAQYGQRREAGEALVAWQQKAEALSAIREEQRPHELALEGEKAYLLARQQELEGHSQQVKAMQAERGQAEASLAAVGAELTVLSGKRKALAKSEQALRETQQMLQSVQGERRLLEQEHGQLQRHYERVARLKEEQKLVETNLAEASVALEGASAGLAAVEAEVKQHAGYLGELQALEVDQPRLRGDMELIQERLAQLRDAELGICPLCHQELSPEHRNRAIADQERQGKQLGDRYRQNRERLAELTGEIGRLSDRIKRKAQVEREVRAQQQRQATAQARLEEIDRALAEWGAEQAERLEELSARLDDNSALASLQTEVRELSSAVGEQAALESAFEEARQKASRLEARQAEISRAVEAWEGDGPSSAAELAQVKATLAGGAYAAHARQALVEIRRRADELGYDPDAHQAVRQQVEALAESEDRYQALQQARAAVAPLEETLADLEKQIGAEEARLAEQSERHQEATTFLASLAEGSLDVGALEDEVANLREEVTVAERLEATSQQRVEVLANQRSRREAALEERAEITLLVQRLKLLEKACGREGVQALLIERALPEIEDDANELLDRLSGGKMRVTFETQRQLKTRDHLAETLDIRITDGAGERPYENFSGGEQFRVNFAIRLALSKLLAKRAGARLQTLVIDEGFGSQDVDGRQRLIEAINTIQSDFQRILVITHIDELRDAFPNRIEVEKGPAGSILTIL